MSAPLSSPFWAPPPAQPQPAQPKRKRSVLLTVCPFILANEFCERLAFYGVYTNMIVYLQSYMDMTMADAAFQLSMFEGTCYVTPLLGAYLADSFWGRYTTILVFSTVYMVGMLLLAASASVPGLKPLLGGSPTPLQVSMLFLSLYIVAVGTGGIKPTVSAFGADQFDERDPQDRREKKSFFNWFYFVINIGSLLAVTVVVQIQEKISWGLGFAIPAVAMLLAILCFVSGSGLYRHAKIGKSPLQRVVGVCWTAMRQSQRDTARARQPRPPAAPLPPGRGNGVLTQPLLQSAYPTPAESAAPNIAGPNQRQLTASASFRWLERAIENVQVEETTSAMEVAGRLKGYTPRQVEEVKMVLRLLPVFFATIMYWTLYNQMGTLFVSQGMLMNRDITLPGGKVFTIASANLAVFDTLSIILLIPVYDQMLVPALKRCGVHITQLQRCGWGMVLSVVAMVVAGAVESFRLSRHEQGLAPPHIVWQVPQYLLVGGSEVLASIAQLEFFYDQAPDVMRSCAMALQLLSTAMGNYLSGAVLQLVQGITSRHGNPGWLPKDLNQGHADFFLYLLAGMMMVNIVAFSIVAMRYVYKDVDHWESMPRLPSVLEWSRRAEPWARPQAVQGIQEQRPAATAIAISGRQTPEMVADVGPYGRSVTYQPSSPALPFNFR